jgi:hypothetical protein
VISQKKGALYYKLKFGKNNITKMEVQTEMPNQSFGKILIDQESLKKSQNTFQAK